MFQVSITPLFPPYGRQPPTASKVCLFSSKYHISPQENKHRERNAVHGSTNIFSFARRLALQWSLHTRYSHKEGVSKLLLILRQPSPNTIVVFFFFTKRLIMAARQEEGFHEEHTLTCFKVFSCLQKRPSNEDFERARSTAFQEIRPGAGF